jgi:hypothetical protein
MEQHLRLSPRISLTLLGTSFGFRSGDRAGRKFRPAQGGGGGSGWGEEWVEGEWSEVFRGLEATAEAESKEARGECGSSRRQRNRKATTTAVAATAAAGGKTGEVSADLDSVIVGLGTPRELGEAKIVHRRKRGKSRRKDPPTWGRFEEVHA